MFIHGDSLCETCLISFLLASREEWKELCLKRYKEGAEAMREKAAKESERYGRTRKNYGGTEWDHGLICWANEIAEAIRALEA